MADKYAEMCQKGLLLTETCGIVTALSIKVTFAFIGFFAQLYVSIWKKDLSKSLNKNTQLLLNLHYFFVVTSCVGTIAAEGFDLYRLTIGKAIRHNTDCPVPPMNPITSVVLKDTKLFGTAGTSFSMFALTIERVYATLRPHNYEKVSIKFGITLAILAVAGDVACFFFHVYYADYSEDVALTTVTKGALQMSLYMLYSAIVSEIFILIAQSVLMLINLGILRGNKQILKSLNYKSQIRENVESLKYLCTLSFIHAFLYLTMAILMPTLANAQTDPKGKQLTTIMTEVIIIYFVALPAVHTWRCVVKKRNARKLQIVHHIGNKENRVKMEQTKHFEMLDEMFNKPQ